MNANSVSFQSVTSVPNLLTILRILLIPVLVVLLMDPAPRASVLAAATFFLACWSDFFDGYLARRHGLGSALGKLLDPLADKLIVMAALVMLTGLSREPRLPAWIVVLIVGRELAVTGLRAIALSEGIVLAAQELGKYKTVLQMFALHGLLLHYPFFGIDFHSAGMYFLYMSLVVSLWSGIDYHVRVVQMVAAARSGVTQ